MDRERKVPPEGHEAETSDEAGGEAHAPDAGKKPDRAPIPPNPPRTTTGKWTSPKFGSAGSGGAEFEPGPERD